MKNVLGLFSFLILAEMAFSVSAEASSDVEIMSPEVIGGIVAVGVLTYLVKRFFER